MSPRDALARDVGALAAGRALTSVVELGVALAFVRVLAPAEFGAFALVLGVAEVGRQLGAMGLPEAAAAFTARHTDTAPQTLAAIRHVARMTAVCAWLGVALALHATAAFAPVSDASRSILRTLAPTVATAVALDVVVAPLVQVLVARGRGRLAAALTAGPSLLNAAAALVLAARGHLAAVGVAMLAVALVRFGFARAAVAREGLLAAHATRHDLRPILRFAGPLALHAVSSKVHRQLDKVVVVALLGDVAGATYGAVTLELPVLTAIPFAIGTVMLPRHAASVHRGDLHQVVSDHLSGIRKVSLALVPTLVFLEVFAHEVVPVVLGAAYASAVLPFRIATLTSVQRVAHFGSVLSAFDDTASIARLSLTMVALDVACVVPATLAYGVVGATAASTTAALLVFAGYQARIAQHVRRPVHAILPLRALGGAALCALAACGPAALVFRGQAPGAQGLMAASTLYLATYLVLATVTRTVHVGDFRDLGRLVRFGGSLPRGATP